MSRIAANSASRLFRLLGHRSRCVNTHRTLIAVSFSHACQRQRLEQSFRPFSSSSSDEDEEDGAVPLFRMTEDPGRLVSGLKEEQIRADKVLFDFMIANFPEAFIVEGQEEEEEEEEQLYSDDPEINALLAELNEDSYEKYVERKAAHAEKTKKHPRNIRPLATFLRDPVTEDGSRRCRQMRRDQGLIPGLIYGKAPNGRSDQIFIKTPARFLQSEIDKHQRWFESRVYDLTVYESMNATLDEDELASMPSHVERVIPTSVQRHPVKETVFCANFLRYHAKMPIKIPVKYINEEESRALKSAGWILPLQRTIECIVEEGVDIPDELEVECTGLQMKGKVQLDRVYFPDGVTISKAVKKRGDDFLIGVVQGSRRGLEGEDDEEEGEEGSTAAA